LSSYRLDWQQLLPQTKQYSLLFQQAESIPSTHFFDLQARLGTTLQLFCHPYHPAKLLLIKGPEDRRYLSLVAEAVTACQPLLAEAVDADQPPTQGVRGCRYEIQGNQVSCHPATRADDNFAATTHCIAEEWAEQATLFGSLYGTPGNYQLQPGLIHQVNGGILILSLRVLFDQPWLWPRLKQILLSGQFHWYPADETRPLPLAIPPMPLNVRLILVGDDLSLLDFSDLEAHSELFAIYSEIEPELSVTNAEELKPWIGYVNGILAKNQLPPLPAATWPCLLQAAVRRTEDHHRLPLCPFWLENLLMEARLMCQEPSLTAEILQNSIEIRRWRESYLPELVQRDIHHGQIRIETKGSEIGQVNGLSVVQYPGHMLACGEPSRISCVVHLGDGDVIDVERKAELGGNIHVKGMLIMQAYLISELDLDQPLPFSASLVFEQSYGEVDGDSASLAGLCTLVSALAQQPLSQQIAVTGAVDQFGRVQAVGGLNEKIEGFFAVCEQRGLSGEQGVIIPATNKQQLCLSDAIVQAVRKNRFHLWVVDHVSDALPLLTGIPFKRESGESLIGLINERIANLAETQDRQRIPFLLRWLTRFTRR
jgi:Lon-like ATP-dependent protease